MTPRSIHHLPPNLTLDQASGRYRFRDPRTGKRTWFGRDRATAIQRAQEANRGLAILAASADAARMGTPTIASTITLYQELVFPTKPWDDSTRANHLYALRLYTREFGSYPIAAVDRVYLADWLNRRCTTADAYNHHRARLIDIWRFAISRRWCNFNEAEATLPRSGSRKIPANRKLRTRLTLEHFWAIHAAAPGWLRIAMELSLVTLQARAEVCALRREDKRGGYLYIIRKKTAGTTDLAFFRIVITPQIEDIWTRAWADGIASPYLVHYLPRSQRPQHAQNKPHWASVTPGYLTRTFQETRDGTGLFAALEPRQRPTFHEIRSLGARTYIAQGYPRDYVRALMAHTDEATTRIYLENPGQLTDTAFREVRAELRLKA